jgi:hypothetical protein
VKAGAALEEEAKDAIEAGNAARNSVEERINRVRENFNLQRPVRGEDLLALHEKIDRLTARVEALSQALEGGGASARKSPARKKAARGAAATTARAKTKTRTKAKAKAKATTATKASPGTKSKAASRKTATASRKRS